jgi:hypothetical protein
MIVSIIRKKIKNVPIINEKITTSSFGSNFDLKITEKPFLRSGIKIFSGYVAIQINILNQ